MVKLPEESGGNFEKAPAGNHLATCFAVIDLGTQREEFEGDVKHVRKVRICWELPNELTEEGTPHTQHRDYTLSSSTKAMLRKHLESWRSKPFSPEDFGTFEISNVVGAACFLTIVHKGKSEYANVEAVGALPKGTPTPALINSPIKFDLDEFDQSIFDALPPWVQSKIVASPEYKAITGIDVDAGGDPDDDSPF